MGWFGLVFSKHDGRAGYPVRAGRHALSLALSTPGRGADTEVGSTQFLMMSDLHFDPMADPKLVDRLSFAEPEEWPDIFESSDNKTPARYGADGN
jgi:hypothetical protein